MAFGLFKKKKKEKVLIDPTQVRLNQLTKGTFIDYDLKTWEVSGVSEYDWGDGYMSDEFVLSTADESCYLSVEEDGGELSCTITYKIRVRDIVAHAGESGGGIGFQSRRGGNKSDIVKIIIQEEEPPMEVIYNDIVYYRDEESVGYYHDTANPDTEEHWHEVVSWTYYDETEKLILSIDQWGNKEFEASQGIVAEEHEFSNILFNQ